MRHHLVMRTLAISSIALVVTAVGCTQTSERQRTGGSAPAASTAAAPAPPGRAKAQTACELLTPSEIAGFLKVPEVKKDEVNSGENVRTHVDICTWYVKEGSSGGVEVRLHRAASGDDDAVVAFTAARLDTVDYGGEPEPIAGVGEEAAYRRSPDGSYNAVWIRARAGAATTEASSSKDTLIAMARLAPGWRSSTATRMSRANR